MRRRVALDEIGEGRSNVRRIRTRQDDLVDRRGYALDRTDDVHVAVIEFERIEITDRDDRFAKALLLKPLDQMSEVLRLREALRSNARAIATARIATPSRSSTGMKTSRTHASTA